MYRRLGSVATMLVGLLCVVSAALAEPRKINTDENRVAIQGYDTVAYFTLGKATKGEPRFEARWEDVRWQFASAEHRDLFLRDPERYAPRFGGFCAVGLARGHLAVVDPEVWQIVNDKLFLIYSKQSQETLQADVSGTIAVAEKNWRDLGRR